MRIADFNSYPKEVIDRTNEFVNSLCAFNVFSLFETTIEHIQEKLAETILKHWISEGDLNI
jgi:hypothetical protein